MFWKWGMDITKLDVTSNFIDVIVDDGRKWRRTGFYGEPARERKHKSWEYLQSLHQVMDIPWMVFGDFNEILLRKVTSTQHFCPKYLTNPHQ